jgi:hypothetical protein
MPQEPPKLEFKRAFADHSGTCQPCQQETNRLITFGPPGATRVDAMFLCDNCLEGIKAAQVRKVIADA